MDILAYEYMLQGLREYNDSKGNPRGSTVVPYSTKDTSYPFTVFEEIRNTANPLYNTCHDRVASVGYRVDVYAKTKGNITKQQIARECAQVADEYLTAIGLERISFNVIEEGQDGVIYHVIMTYSGNLHENRRKLI
jgi:hypothetical protein